MKNLRYRMYKNIWEDKMIEWNIFRNKKGKK